MARVKELTGMVFGRLTAIRPDTELPRRGWVCKCDCGKEKSVTTSNLTSGKTKSCGCKRVDAILENGLKNIKHGASNKGDRTYSTWLSMRERCRNEEYERYYGRGISVDERWEIYSNFLSDMGHRPDGTTLDRINVHGNYEPGNCRWATSTVQQRNKVRARKFIIDDVPVPCMDVADCLGIKKSAMQYFFTVARKLKEKYGRIPDIEDRCSMDR